MVLGFSTPECTACHLPFLTAVSLAGIYLAALIALVRGWFRPNQSIYWFVFMLIFASLLFPIISHFGKFQGIIRYTSAFFAGGIPLALAALIHSMRPLAHGRTAIISITALLLTIHSASLLTAGVFNTQSQPTTAEKMSAHFNRNNIRFVYAPYWIAMELIYVTTGKLAVSTSLGPTSVSYGATQEAEVYAAGGLNTAYVLPNDSEALRRVTQLQTNYWTTVHVGTIDAFTIFWNCEPPPNIDYLIKKLPKDDFNYMQ